MGVTGGDEHKKVAKYGWNCMRERERCIKENIAQWNYNIYLMHVTLIYAVELNKSQGLRKQSLLSIVSVSVSRKLQLRNSAGILVPGSHLCTRIWVRAMIDLLKMPSSIFQSKWRESRNALRTSGNSLSPLGAQQKDACAASQTLLTGIRFLMRLWKKEIGSLSSDVFERRTSTGSEPSSILNCLDATKFVLLGVFTL